MPRKSKVLVGVILAAIAIVALTVAPAFAGTYDVSLGITRTSGTYGQEFDLTPSTPATDPIVGDTYTLQALQPDGITWANFGEGLKVDETGTVIPQSLSVDESFLPWYWGKTWHPIQFKVVYKTARSKDASGVVISNVSTENVSFTVQRASKVNLVASVPSKVKHGKAFTIAGWTAPNVGRGITTITVVRPNGASRTYRIAADDSGYAALRANLKSVGDYKVKLHWLGNAFGPGSKTVTKVVKVR